MIDGFTNQLINNYTFYETDNQLTATIICLVQQEALKYIWAGF